MTLLDDARRMDCLCDASEGLHSDQCLLILKPRIVAALEAAEALAEAIEDYGRRRTTGTHDRVVDTLAAYREARDA